MPPAPETSLMNNSLHTIDLLTAPVCLIGNATEGTEGVCTDWYSHYVGCLTSYNWTSVPESCVCQSLYPFDCFTAISRDCYNEYENWYLGQCSSPVTSVGGLLLIPDCAKNCIKLSALRKGCLSLLRDSFCVLQDMVSVVAQCVAYAEDCVSAGTTYTSYWAAEWYEVVCEEPPNPYRLDSEYLLQFNTTDGSIRWRPDRRLICCVSCCRIFGITLGVVIATVVLIGFCSGLFS